MMAATKNFIFDSKEEKNAVQPPCGTEPQGVMTSSNVGGWSAGGRHCWEGTKPNSSHQR